MEKYRWMIPGMIERMQTAFDTTVISMSGGALGLSLTFYKEIVSKSSSSIYLLESAWFSWTVSIVCVLFSYWFSRKSLEKILEQVDEGTVHTQRLGGHFSWINVWLANIGGLFLVIGIAAFAFFVLHNLDKATS